MGWKSAIKPTKNKLILTILFFLLLPLPYFMLVPAQIALGAKPVSFPQQNITPFIMLLFSGFQARGPPGIIYTHGFFLDLLGWFSIFMNLIISYLVVSVLVGLYRKFR